MARRDIPGSFGSKRLNSAQGPASVSRCSMSDTRSKPATSRTGTARIICASLQPWAGLPTERGRPTRMRFAASASNSKTTPPRAVNDAPSRDTSSLIGERQGVTMVFTRLVTPIRAGWWLNPLQSTAQPGSRTLFDRRSGSTTFIHVSTIQPENLRTAHCCPVN